jgi:hypothetical protein
MTETTTKRGRRGPLSWIFVLGFCGFNFLMLDWLLGDCTPELHRNKSWSACWFGQMPITAIAMGVWIVGAAMLGHFYLARVSRKRGE